MSATSWAFGVGLLLAAGSGCVSCGNDVCKTAFDAGPLAEAPLCDRQHVYVFLINGLTPNGAGGLDGLRIKLAERGFEKTYRGDLGHAVWMAFEMHSVLKCDPSARFVLVGYDFACGAAMELAPLARRLDWPVDAVVLLDPVINAEAGHCPAPTAVIRSHFETPCGGEVPSVCIPKGSHWTLPANETTVAAIVEILKDSAAKVVHEPVLGDPADAAAVQRWTAPVPGASAEWLFLHDQLGTHTLPLTPLPAWTPPGPCEQPGVDPLPQGMPLPAPRKVGSGP